VKLDAGSVLLQWAAGGLFFLWITTRRREVSLGYGWLMRIVYGVLAIGALALFIVNDHISAAIPAALLIVATGVALIVSVVRKDAGVRGREEVKAERRARVSAMIGREDEAVAEHGPEFPPILDIPAPIFGLVALFAAAEFAGGPYPLALARLVIGALFLGVVTDAMLLGHWYLVQPGLRRDPINELVVWTMGIWPFEIAALLWPVGMVSVINGTIDDGYNGLLGWVWIVAAITTIGLVVMTHFALKEKSYSAVMAATGLLYLAILTAFGTDLLARAVLKP
jgi:hypothetical protein